jgi:large subunit ribosomal protein L20
MTRVKGGSVAKNRRRKVLKAAKGYFGSKHRLFKTAQEQVFHSGKYAYRDRKQNKRNFRKLWITRINAGCRANGISYSKFMNGLTIAGISINRKMLSEIAIQDPKMFTELVETSKKALEGKKTTTKEVKEVAKKVVEIENTIDYSKLTVAELKEIAKEKGVENYTAMKKAELVDALK